MEQYLEAAQQGALARAKVASALRQGNWNDSVIAPNETDYSYQAPSSGGGSTMDSSGNGKAIGGMIRSYMDRNGTSSPGRNTLTPSRTGTLGQGTGNSLNGLNITSGDSSWLSRLFGGQ